MGRVTVRCYAARPSAPVIRGFHVKMALAVPFDASLAACQALARMVAVINNAAEGMRGRWNRIPATAFSRLREF